VYSYAAIGETPAPSRDPKTRDVEQGDNEIQNAAPAGKGERGFPEKVTTVLGQNRPFFHIDVAAAVESAIAAAETKLAITDSASSGEKVIVQAHKD
jgi:sodium-independent sulfate anion transporter 11